MIRDLVSQAFQEALSRLISRGELPEANYPDITFQEPKQPEHGDLATSFALAAAKAAQRNPKVLSEALAAEAREHPAFTAVEVAGPGFINIRLDGGWAAERLSSVLASEGKDLRTDDAHYARSAPERPLKINVEFVSVNPNGPITIGSGRGAAFGSALCSVLEAGGHLVHREYYINDGVNSEQMRLFAESVKSYVLDLPFPEKGYRGDYVQDVAARLKGLPTLPESEAPISSWQEASQDLMLVKQKEDLAAFRVLFDTWFSEQSLHDAGTVAECIGILESTGVADTQAYRTKVVKAKDPETGKLAATIEKEDQPKDEDDAEGQSPTLWLRSTVYGDDQDRVLRRKDGRLTYISSDVAYHRDKFNRPVGADKLITILGPDHHGYIGRLTAVVAALFAAEGRSEEEALALAKERLEVVIFALVRFVKDGKPAPMRKRDGNIYALIDLIKEIGSAVKPEGSTEEQMGAGADVARFFYLMRSHETTFDFDLDLAARQSDENPVFYVQYAHARICSLLDRAAEQGFTGEGFDPALLTHPREMALMLKVFDLGGEISRTCEDYAVNRLTTYAVELARSYHAFYDACRVAAPEAPELSNARVALCRAARVALQSVLGLLAVSCPERM